MRFVLGALLLLVGCSKTTRPLLQLDMYAENQSALYIVDQDGTIHFGGGLDALSGKTTWTGELNSQQLLTLRNLLQDDVLQDTENRLTHCFVIQVQEGKLLEKYVTPLTDASAIELYYFLEESTLSRVRSYLDSLPKPSMDVITDRQIQGAKQ